MLELHEDHDSAPRGERDGDVALAPNRASYIGGSDISALLGVNPYRSALDVYAQKIGVAVEQPESEPMEWGDRLEPVIAQKYADAERLSLTKGSWTPGPKSYIGGTPDYLVAGLRRGLEVKTAGLVSRGPDLSVWGESGGDEVPEHYAAQCHYYMAITGFSRWDLAAFIGGRGYATFRLHHDAETGAALLELAERFWVDNVLARVPPEPDGSEAARRALALLWPKNTKPLIKATPDIEILAHEYRVACEAFDRAEEAKTLAENRVKAVIADADGIEGAGWRVTFKRSAPSVKVDMEALEADPAGALLCAKYRRSVEGARRIHKNWNTNPKGK